nr:MAG TPA: hypothetical protein [Caudoviricetes sp.]
MPVTLRGLVRFLFICVIMNIHHRQRATRLSHSSFLYLLISTISDNIFLGILWRRFDEYSRTVLDF